MHYYVVGINGSGKTSLVRAIAAETGMAAVHGTAALMQYLKIPGDYDALRAMDQAEVLERWAETAEDLVAQYGHASFLLDTHIMNLTHGRVIRRDGDWIAKYDALVLVKADAATVLSRIAQDTNKDRAMFPPAISDAEKVAILDAYQQQTERLFQEVSSTYGLPSLVIQNDAELADGVRTFVSSPIYHKK